MTPAAPPRTHGPHRVVVHNTDGVNPYSAELASLLHEEGLAVTLVDAANSEHAPARGVRWLRRLPENYGNRGGAAQFLSLARGLATTVWVGAARRHVVLVSFTRFPVEDLVLAGLATLGHPVVVVVHNPEPREAESRLARGARRALLRSAGTVVVHAERLRGRVDPVARGPVRVCPHPPYAHTAPPAEPALVLDPERRWLAFIGALRWDKGAGLLPEVVENLPPEQRGSLGLVVCGRGRLPDEAWERIRRTGVEVHDLTSERPVPQETFLDVLRNHPLVLAPYVAATQSGSVIMALSTGCRVLAFDEGGIPDVLDAAGLVPTGDAAAMGRAAGAGRGGTALADLGTWRRQAAETWAEAVRCVDRPSTQRRGG
ncbi:glycosyltransferase [Paenibacillus sp. TRM 82003]|uniref:glycosyltransferase n=1 Tax=Kineococcus sp. TRM81007 TaxID=2925831 RepID=UPI001F5805E4|nr:glycosyltransferase [Kineococcus sp. TRM81007]MCI2238418.1 glycosyltransferase [Kineococcus sp. TRM81007]MCI3922069.1 glycosyltransferase [Paenibacillus sp. TRM 82003]